MTQDDAFWFAWHSARAASHVGFKVYKQWAGTPDEKLVHVTAILEGPERFKDWGDEIYVGCVHLRDFVREVKAK